MISQDRDICDVLEENMMQRKPPLDLAMYVSMHSGVINEDGPTEWRKSVASKAGFTLHLGGRPRDLIHTSRHVPCATQAVNLTP